MESSPYYVVMTRLCDHRLMKALHYLHQNIKDISRPKSQPVTWLHRLLQVVCCEVLHLWRLTVSYTHKDWDQQSNFSELWLLILADVGYRACSPGRPWTSRRTTGGWSGRCQEDLNFLLKVAHVSAAQSPTLQCYSSMFHCRHHCHLHLSSPPRF